MEGGGGGAVTSGCPVCPSGGCGGEELLLHSPSLLGDTAVCGAVHTPCTADAGSRGSLQGSSRAAPRRCSESRSAGTARAAPRLPASGARATPEPIGGPCPRAGQPSSRGQGAPRRV